MIEIDRVTVTTPVEANVSVVVEGIVRPPTPPANIPDDAAESTVSTPPATKMIANVGMSLRAHFKPFNIPPLEEVVALHTQMSQGALIRVSPCMNIIKRRTITNAFITSQFGYCPLVWMFHSRKLNNRINKIHERALRIVYNDDLSSFDELLNRDSSFTIHSRNIQAIAIELYKVVNGLSPEIMNQVFPLKDILLHCSRFPFKTSNVKPVSYGMETLGFMGPKIWALSLVRSKRFNPSPNLREILNNGSL